MRENGGALVLVDGRVPNELDSSGTGAMGSGVDGGGGRLRSNQDGARARRKKGGVGGGVGREGHGSCTRVRVLTELDDRLIGADSGGGGGRKEDPPVR